jgi:histidine triad (HIT) family protein
VTDCVFCKIRDGEVPAHVVLDEPAALAFLDQRPVFPGHVLVIPRTHSDTLLDLHHDALEPFFDVVQRVAGAVMAAMDADGTFVGINNVVSQSVPHLHAHVVPRKFKDGLRGFFWPRQKYADEDAMIATAASIRAALA